MKMLARYFFILVALYIKTKQLHFFLLSSFDCAISTCAFEPLLGGLCFEFKFLLIAAVEKGFDRPPSLKEVAYALVTSHQNIKQIANQLQRKGFIALEKDSDDRRVTRLNVTEKNRRYWDSRAGEHEKIVLGVFSFLSEKEIVFLHSTVNKMLSGLDEIYSQYR